ncbi:Golgi-associated RAB2 interactor protein 5A [Struthio camelus]|uniref:Golgi-associated RAB2 interactor protein 5A n=1 Tax=Struthio camelus TaxID=8801 RepID=UPI003603F64C
MRVAGPEAPRRAARAAPELRPARLVPPQAPPGCGCRGPSRLPCALCQGMGGLWRCLERGEYGRLRDCPLFESDFLQVTKSGDAASRVTVGIAATSPRLALPDLMLLARPAQALAGPCRCALGLPAPAEELELFGLLPLQFVRLSLHSEKRHQLKVSLASGRTFYLQLLAPRRRLERLFGRWLRLLYLLRHQHPPRPRGTPRPHGEHPAPPNPRPRPAAASPPPS